MPRERALFDLCAPPGWPTQATSRLLAVLRDRGLPFLRSADDVTLRTLSLNLRAAAVRTLTGPIRAHGTAPSGTKDDASFAQLGADDEVTILQDNRESFHAKCVAIESAERSIDCALYYVADDATGMRFADLLARASARGVRVRLAVDAHATMEKQYAPFDYEANSSRGSLVLLEKLRAEGCEVHLLGGASWAMHRKFLFLDRAKIVLGGRNVADHYAEPGWRDLELVLEGPFAESFAGVVDGCFERPTEAQTRARGVLVGVPARRGTPFARAVASLVESATSTVDIEHAYLLSQPWLEDALRAAVARGVRVRAFTNSGTSNDLPFMNWRLATSVRALARAGVKVFRRTTTAATLHTKLVIGDRRRVVFGSSNLDYFSPTWCAELDIAVENEELGRRLTSVIEEGLREPTTQAVGVDTSAAAELDRECSPWSVSRICDLLIHDLQ